MPHARPSESTPSRKVTSLNSGAKNWIAVALIIALCVVSFFWARAEAPIRQVERTSPTSAYTPPALITEAPTRVEQAWSAPTVVPEPLTPVVVSGVVITASLDSEQKTRVEARDPETGESIWTHAQPTPLCALNQAWDSVILTFSTNMGCSDTISLDAHTGKYNATRSALAADPAVSRVRALGSSQYVGIMNSERVELWRDDLVRTVEYGKVPAKQNPNEQPHEDCSLSSALTSNDLLAITERCGAKTMLRFQKAKPEDSHKPELERSTTLPASGKLIALTPSIAAVYIDGGTPTINTYSVEGVLLHTQPVAQQGPDSDQMLNNMGSHKMWFDGERLYLLSYPELEIEHIFDNALGMGTVLNNKLLYPTDQGIAVFNLETNKQEAPILLDRSGHKGPISLTNTRGYLLEERTEQDGSSHVIVGLRQAP